METRDPQAPPSLPPGETSSLKINLRLFVSTPEGRCPFAPRTLDEVEKRLFNRFPKHVSDDNSPSCGESAGTQYTTQRLIEPHSPI